MRSKEVLTIIEGRQARQHLVQKHTERPPIDGLVCDTVRMVLPVIPVSNLL